MVNTANSPDRIAEPHTREVRLSRRQAECLSWVEEGKSAVDIGGILGLSARTVEEYIS
jgi:DNA-binding CsgD family transcriptional regulator